MGEKGERRIFFGFLSGKLIIQQSWFIWQRGKEGTKEGRKEGERVLPHYTVPLFQHRPPATCGLEEVVADTAALS